MKFNWKKLLCLALSCVLTLGALAGCGAGAPAETTEPKATEPEAEAKVLKILTLGSSSSVDSNHMINLVAAAEGVEQTLLIGTLYYSGCKLSQHVEFIKGKSNVYDLYISSTDTPNNPPTIMKEVTMADALHYEYWDIIFLQPGGFEGMQEENYTNGNIEFIRAYVDENKYNPLAKYGWHQIGVSSTDPDLIAMYPYSPNSYDTNAAKYDYNREAMLLARTELLDKYVMSDPSYEYIVASCTAVENAITSYLGQKGIKRDYTHLTDLGRLIASYVWYCELYGIEKLEEIKVDAIPKSFLKSTTDKTQDLVLTDMEKAVIIEAVNNTIADPLHITPSQYTEAPAQ